MELDDTLAFIVTELIEGKNLKDDVAANGRYVGDDLERLARKLIEATKAVHAAGIVHRDIKPTNVMVSAAGPVLVDFGIAMGEGESHVTRTGLVMGTPGFIAPEIIDGAESDDATDWWSVASVLAFAATGAPVFGTKPMMAVLEREGKRGGERKNSDSWIRVATFPWHLVKALLLAIPRILLLVIIYMAGTAVATAALALPVHTISWYFTADWGIPVPLLNDVPFSASGLALGGFMAIGWLVTVFAPQSMMIRLGGGVLRGLKHSRPAGAPSTEVGGAPPAPVAPAPKGGGRGTVLFTIWAIITVALCAMPILGMPINWMPFA